MTEIPRRYPYIDLNKICRAVVSVGFPEVMKCLHRCLSDGMVKLKCGCQIRRYFAKNNVSQDFLQVFNGIYKILRIDFIWNFHIIEQKCLFNGI